MDRNGKGPLVDQSVAWAREPSGEHRTVERRRVRRRTRVKSEIRSRIRRRVVIVCVGALLFMAIGIYVVLGRDGASGSIVGAAPVARVV